MAASTDIKWYSSFNTNAPKLDNNWGALVNVLKKCLVEGFGAVQSSATSFNGDFLTVTFTEDHGFLLHQLVEVSGSGVTSVVRAFKEKAILFNLPILERKWDIIDLNYLSKYEVSSAWQSQAFLLYKQNFTVKEISLTLSKQYTTVYNALRRGGYLE